MSQYFEEANDIMVTVLVGISLLIFGALICYHAIKAFGRQGKKQIRKSKMLHKMKYSTSHDQHISHHFKVLKNI